MPDKKHTTLSGITPQQLIRLQILALALIGERSVSALIRRIADNGYVIKYPAGSEIKSQLIVEQHSDFESESPVVVASPKEEGEPDA